MSESESKRGMVYLVGAGPGDPGLITVRGRDLLERAEVVVFDHLANPALLRHCPRADLIYVGKQASKHAMSQGEINRLLVEKGLAGQLVVRLKGGDPFVFGRGGEECEALAAAGVGFEVVPGITSAIAGPAYAGIPVTHRDFNSSYTLVTGHEKEADYQDPAARERGTGAASDVDWSVLAKLPCLAFYMGVKSLPSICRRLMENGMSGEMPAATIQWGTTSRQRTVVGTVSTLARKVEEAGISPPAMTIIGRVVELRETMNWFEKRPLFGQTIVVTRTRQQASSLAKGLEDLGARVMEAPTIELEPACDAAVVDEALRMAGTFDWIVFTSQNGVAFAKQRLRESGVDVRAFGGAKIAAIGQATADAIREQLCLKVDLCPEEFVADALAGELLRRGEIRGRRFLMLRADIARPILRQKLAEGGASEVRDVAIYQTKPATSLSPALVEALSGGQVQWVTFTSSSTARNFAKLLGADYLSRLSGVKIASIGPITTGSRRELELVPTVEAKTYTIEGLIDALVAGARGGRSS